LIEGEEKTMEFQGGTTVVILDSKKKSKLTLKGRCLKVMIDSCENIEIDINSTVLTSLEIVRCKKMNLICSNQNQPINTISIDLSEEVHFEMKQSLWMGRIYSSNCFGIKVSIPNKPIHSATYLKQQNDQEEEEEEEENNSDFSSQEITYISKGSLVTERVVREG